jgi:hypothetical protein
MDTSGKLILNFGDNLMRTSVLLISMSALLFMNSACTQPSGVDSDKPQSPPTGTPPAGAQVHSNLAQLMRGVMFPNSNVIFAAQSADPAKIKATGDPSTATDPLAGTYGQWAAVENAGLALAESANLLTIPGRMCQNGKAVPMQNPDWAGLVQGLRDAGMAAYKAGQSKNQDNVLMAADTLTTACSNCHDKYREKPGGEQDRCM